MLARSQSSLGQIELTVNDATKIADENSKDITSRLQSNLEWLRAAMSRDGGGSVLAYIDSDSKSPAKNTTMSMRGYIYEVIEDVRMVYALRLYPMEEKIALKSAMAEVGLNEAIVRLENSEKNLADKDYQGCIGECRECLARVMEGLTKQVTGKETGSFAGNGDRLRQFGGIDAETDRLSVATYSYLSSGWKEGHAPNQSDAHYAIRETYLRIDMLLKRYADFKSNKN